MRELTQENWMARFASGGCEYWIGTYREKTEAEAAVMEFRQKLHGEFCNHGRTQA